MKKCFAPSGAIDYCSLLEYSPLPNRLFRHRRDGTFEDVTARSGIGGEYNGGTGVTCADFNADGWPDIFVANDSRPNQLWINQRNGTFKTTRSPPAAPSTGMENRNPAWASPGGDLLGNGYEDLVVANLTGQYAYLYANDGKSWFDDRAAASGLIAATRRCTGFGLGMLDYDNDGRLDLFMACGAVTTIEEQVRTGSLYPLAQPNILLHNSGQGRFEDVSSRAEQPFSRMEEVGRSRAVRRHRQQ